MAKTKDQKAKTVEILSENLKKATAVVFVNVQGLKVKEIVALRKKAKEAMGNLKVAKKTLINLALRTEKELADKLNIREMAGEVALLFSFEDPLKPLKAFYQLSKESENLKFISGIFENDFISKEEVIAMAQLPPKQELQAKLVFCLQSPVSGLVNTLKGNIKGLVYVLANVKK